MAYKVFTNGSPLPASDLNTYLMNQSVMVFANASARSAALTSPTEGMVTWLEDTNKLEVYTGAAWSNVGSPITTQGDLIVGDSTGSAARLGIGANGTVLSSNGTTASWQTPSVGAESWTVLAGPLNLSGSTTSITSFTSYNKYMLILNTVGTTATTDWVQLRFNSDSASNYITHYQQWNFQSTYSASNFGAFSDTSGSIDLFRKSSNSGSRGSATIIISGAKSSGNKIVESFGGADASTGNSHIHSISRSRYTSASAITSIQIISAGGTFSVGSYVLLGAD